MLDDFNKRLVLNTLDFEAEELTFRQGIWHARVDLLIKFWSLRTPVKSIQPITERICSEKIRFWLEEGQELELATDPKYDKLTEVVEDIDNIARSLKLCATQDEIDQIDKQENSFIIDIDHLI